MEIGNKPIIFLDFDGVVETIYWDFNEDGVLDFNVHKHRHEQLNNKQAIGWLNELYKQVPYDVVISSTWRYYMEVDELQALLTRSGFDPRIKVIGKTPVLYQQRGFEIDKWLKDNEFDNKFIIIDDDCDMCYLSSYLVRTDCQLGFTIYDYGKALSMLTGEMEI